MLRYETLFLTIPEITSDEATAIEASLQKIIKNHTGTVLSFERWGKMLLAYPIQKNDYGVYFLVRFEVARAEATAIIEAIKNLFLVKLNESVMRHIVSKLDPKQPLTYTRPDSFEEIPGRHTDSFIKEHRNNFQSNRDSSAAHAPEELDKSF